MLFYLKGSLNQFLLLWLLLAVAHLPRYLNLRLLQQKIHIRSQQSPFQQLPCCLAQHLLALRESRETKETLKKRFYNQDLQKIPGEPKYKAKLEEQDEISSIKSPYIDLDGIRWLEIKWYKQKETTWQEYKVMMEDAPKLVKKWEKVH